MTTTDFTDIKILLRSERAEVAGVTISEANGVYTITVDDFVANEWSEEYPTLSAALDAAHRHKVSDLEARLAERRTVLTDRHPDVEALRRALDRLRPGRHAACHQLRRQPAGHCPRR